MTLPLLVQDRQAMRGPRYAGALASIHDDVESDAALWGAFTPVGDPPPFPWAGRKDEQCRT